ncbi:MAG: HlyC/CorC family transporter [Verrucomicrobiota bacterium]|nr:HlyC/CorC family transporter [Verrucomicrobiota bacterium]
MIEWLLLTLLAVIIQGFFAFFEMACVSFNKVRLHYYVSRGFRRATWLNYLLKRPSRLFGTTLIAINASLQIGSECARRFYESIHIDPDWAPVTQVLIVVVFGELIPMFAARRHPEQMAIAFVPFMVFLARLLSPITWVFDRCARLIHCMLAKSQETPLFLSREEVRMAFEERELGEDEFNDVVSAIFQLKHRTAGQLMLPLAEAQMVSAEANVREVRERLSHRYVPLLPVYDRLSQNVISIVYLRDLLRLSDEQKISEAGKSPWFVTKDTSILQLLDQFRRNNQSLAVILDFSGSACGILTLDQIVDAIFGPEENVSLEMQSHFIDRTLEGSMTVAEFNQQFEADIPGGENKTLSELIFDELDHPPSRGETVRIGRYEWTVLEPTLRGVKTISVHTFQE